MKQKIATLIKSKRMEKGWSQKELAEGVCTQAVISNIEKAEGSPSVELFFNLVKKLDIKTEVVADLFQLKSAPTSSFFTKEIRNNLNERAYDQIEYIIQLVDVEQLTEEDQLYYHFLSATVSCGFYGRIKEAIEKLREIVTEAEKKGYRPLYFEASIMIANCYSELEQYDKAYEEFQQFIPIYKQIEGVQQRLLFLYSYARLLYFKKEVEQAMIYLEECLTLQRREKTFFVLGHVYFLRANILEEQGLIEEAIHSAQNAYTIYDIEQDDLLKNTILAKLQGLKGEKYEKNN